MIGLLEKDYHFTQLKDLDLKARRVSGYLSSFDNIDLDGDVIEKGAFKKSISERKDSIRFLYQHNWEKPHGFFQELEEDDYGLGFVSNPLIDTTFSSDTLKMYEAGIVSTHSIGFEILKKSNKDGVRHLTELKLYEGSNVTMAANPLARFSGLKSLTPTDVNNETKKLLKAFRNGTFTDETFMDLEIAIKQLQRIAFELGKKSLEEPSNDTHSEEPIIETIKEFRNSFTI